jgi:hypothetical protein
MDVYIKEVLDESCPCAFCCVPGKASGDKITAASTNNAVDKMLHHVLS